MTARFFPSVWLWLAFCAAGLSVNLARALEIEWVTAGDPGNTPDTNGLGAAAYPFQISKLEVSVGQYAEFLNAVAANDPHGLWVAGQKIDRSGNPDTFRYAAQAGREREPVMRVTFLNMMRFANWLHHSGGRGDTETGAYSLAGSDGLAKRETSATVWIPYENEWFKAAYFQPPTTGGSPGSYGTYPTRSDLAPKLAKPGDAWEWIEATVFGTHLVIRGGSMCASHEKLLYKVRTHATPTRRYPDTGFRLARAMPPSS